LALGPDGTLYIVDSTNKRIRAVAPDGDIRTVAGNGAGSCADGFYSILCDVGQQAVNARIDGVGSPTRVAVDGQGNVFFSVFQSIYKVGPGGLLEHVAGRTHPPDGNADGALGVDGSFNWTSTSLETLHVGHDGLLYVAESGRTVRRLGADGRILTVAGQFGSGPQGFNGDGQPALQTQLFTPTQVATSPDGTIFIADKDNGRIRSLVAPQPGFNAQDLTFASGDGTLLYRFTSGGRHIDTRNTHRRHAPCVRL
jgi:hypothetical protein